jgi:hypothetical protein
MYVCVYVCIHIRMISRAQVVYLESSNAKEANANQSLQAELEAARVRATCRH